MFSVRCWMLDVALTLLLLSAASASAATRYVWQDSPSPAPPYTNWTTSAHVIQDAVDAAVAGDTVLVAGGLYATGGRTVGTNLLANRVAIDRAIAVESLMGPDVTIIQGYQVPSTTNGDGAIRCVYLTNGASLTGFTLTNGATRTNGALSDLGGGGLRCESTNAVISNCLLAGNSTHWLGGGAYGGALNGCTLNGNSARSAGGGVYSGALNDCILTGNSATEGGAAHMSTLNNCTLASNSARNGGGATESTLNNCTLLKNSAQYGGGAYGGTLYNCTLTGNSAGQYDSPLGGDGGGAFRCSLNNCSLTGNSAVFYGGGSYGGRLANCIVYFNKAAYGPNYSGDTVNYCCTTPMPASGTGNITDDPQLASATHLNAGSPCRGAGSAAYAMGTDIDGEPWANPPAMGCDEYYSGSVTGALTVAILASYTTVAAEFSAGFQALISGHASASRWDFGDGIVVSNRPCAAHVWTAAGDYEVALRAYNESHPGGVSTTLRVHVAANTVHYVAMGSTNPLAPYISWATAATNIQHAVEVATVAGSRVLVTNGVYASVWVNETLRVLSVTGPQFTVIDGRAYDRCVYLANGASLSGFTLTNGYADRGGGVLCESTAAVVSNCVLVGNSAWDNGGGAYSGTLNNCRLTSNSAQTGGGVAAGYDGHPCTLNNCTLSSNSAVWGGGASEGTLNNCVLSGNSATDSGGGATDSTLNHCTLVGNWADIGGGAYGTMFPSRLNNCTLTGNSAIWGGGGARNCKMTNCSLSGNSASYGGGADNSTLNNCTLTGNSATDSGGGASGGTLNHCIVYFNTAPDGANYSGDYGNLNYCCTGPDPGGGWGGDGNITNAPLFVDYAGGNLRLQSNSPCINAGTNYYAPGSTDLDGRPRIVSSTVDIGAYEFQGAGMGEFLGWLQQYGWPTDSSADYLDPDGDGLNTWQEWRCLTDPTNALSMLRLLTPETDGTNVTLRWTSAAGVTYYVLRSTDPGASLQFRLLATNILGESGTTRYTDTNAADLSPRYYRVGVGSYLAPPSLLRPTLTCQYDGGSGTLQLSWSDTGFHLQAQKNTLGVGWGTNWVDHPGGTTSPVTVPVDPQNRSVFYRLVWP
jgi:hypothetical protein